MLVAQHLTQREAGQANQESPVPIPDGQVLAEITRKAANPAGLGHHGQPPVSCSATSGTGILSEVQSFFGAPS